MNVDGGAEQQQMLDLIQETTSPFSVQLVSAAESYRGATYGDPVLDRASLLRRLRKLGASATQRSRTKQFAISQRVLDSFEATLHKLFPRVDIQWR